MFQSVKDMREAVEREKLPLWKVILKEDAKEEGITEEESFAKMKHMYLAMKASVKDYDASRRSASGLAGGCAEKVHVRKEQGKMIAGDFIAGVMEKALAIAEGNACMRRIVAAPTAGSCGVLPAVLISLQEERNYSDHHMTEALYVAGGIGGVIGLKASLAGAQGGCQAEIGSASAMAAAALVYLDGGTPAQCGDACALALKGLMGLVCDPVGGLVEVPCIKRNVIGSVNAITSADMALAGIHSAVDCDEVIDAMRRVGEAMPDSLRETGKGGIAACPSAQFLLKKLQNHDET